MELEQQLNQAVAASNFFETETGRLFVKLANLKINKYTRDILSDKFDDNHFGYVNCKSDLNAYKNMLVMMQRAANPKIKAKLEERLGELNGQ